MSTTDTIRTTPLTDRADRRDERVRLIEESLLVLRGDWPAIGIGLCESVNRAAGPWFSTPGELDLAIEETSAEALRLVRELYGPEVVGEVERLAAVGAEAAPEPRTSPPSLRDRLHLPRHDRRLRPHAG